MKARSASKSKAGTAIALGVLGLAVGLAYMAGGVNWAASVFTAVGSGLWLWSARRSNRERGPDVGPRLVVDRGGALCDQELPRLSVRRIRVANTGSRPIDQVEVTLSKCRPAPGWFQPVRLQRMHGGPHPFSLESGSEVYVDLVALPQGHPEFILIHDSSVHGGLPNGIPIQPLELTVQVTAHALPSVSLVFELSRNALGELELVGKTR
ncbi:MAG TPA: hypothetical protein VHM25_20665 [Polyangiaceae bacterium]|nr:hypothetical protein [Polyangiaceae bacterium]